MNFWNFSYLQFTLGSKLWYLDIMWRNNIKRFEKNMPLQGDSDDKTCDNYFSKNTSYMCALEHHICSRNSKSIKRFVQLNRIQLNVVLTYFSNDGRRSKRWTRGQPPISPMSLTYWSDLIKLENRADHFCHPYNSQRLQSYWRWWNVTKWIQHSSPPWNVHINGLH